MFVTASHTDQAATRRHLWVSVSELRLAGEETVCHCRCRFTTWR